MSAKGIGADTRDYQLKDWSWPSPAYCAAQSERQLLA